MAADTDLPISGKDVRMELLVSGVPQAVADQVTSFTERRRVTQIDTKPIGTSVVYIDQEPDGWEGDIEYAESTPALETFIDAVEAAQRARLPFSIQITRTKHYRDARSKTHMYPDVKVNFESSTRRGQAGQIRMPWVSGVARIPLN